MGGWGHIGLKNDPFVVLIAMSDGSWALKYLQRRPVFVALRRDTVRTQQLLVPLPIGKSARGSTTYAQPAPTGRCKCTHMARAPRTHTRLFGVHRRVVCPLVLQRSWYAPVPHGGDPRSLLPLDGRFSPKGTSGAPEALPPARVRRASIHPQTSTARVKGLHTSIGHGVLPWHGCVQTCPHCIICKHTTGAGADAAWGSGMGGEGVTVKGYCQKSCRSGD